MAFVLSLLAPLLPYILGAVALVVLYFGIKRKGANEVREVLKEHTAKVETEVIKAEAKDEAIDIRAKGEIDALNKHPESVFSSDDPKFKF